MKWNQREINYEKEKENLCTMMQVCNQIQNNKGQLGTQNWAIFGTHNQEDHVTLF